uniref:FYVE-type domain-containing protein n=1 Tax=Anopheles culicifacies TaxID=139723 RepID=A0A182LS02_9DIPT
MKANGTPAGVPIVPVSTGPTTTTNNLLTSMMLMDESIIIQPQFQQLEINGKQPSGDGGSATAAYGTQKERRRRNSSNSKHDLMSPCKPTNGSISPSATHSRFSTPGARSLPLTPPSVPYAADRPPVATFSCPDGLAHALSEQNLRLQQIVYEHRLREEALQRELYATRLALLKKTCQHCCSSSAQPQYGNEDPCDCLNGEEAALNDGAFGGGGGAAQELCLCQAILKHNRRFAHNVRMWRTVRQFLERTRQKRVDCPSRDPVMPSSESFALEDPVSEYYADSVAEDDARSTGSSAIFDDSSDADVEQREERPDSSAGGIPHREEEITLDVIVGGSGGGGGGGCVVVGGGHSDEDENDDAELSSQLMVDSMNENASNCSWEAVDDRSAPSSGANSSQQMQYSSSGVGGSTSVLWVPDHAVTRCTTCQIEFWLGRRKHHCRSCGQIFCADCSEFTAHLPEERVNQPVRLCGPCYQRISSMTVPANSCIATATGSTLTSSAGTGSTVNGSSGNVLSDDTNAFLHRSNVTAAAATMIMRDRITSMSQIQSLLAAECSSEAPRASESCCKANVTAATN